MALLASLQRPFAAAGGLQGAAWQLGTSRKSQAGLPRPCSATLNVDGSNELFGRMLEARGSDRRVALGQAEAAAALEQMVRQARLAAARPAEHQPQASTSQQDQSPPARHANSHKRQQQPRQRQRQQHQPEQQQQQPAGAAPPQRRAAWPTAAPHTAAGEPAPDPKLVSLTKQLLAASSPRQMREALLAAQLSSADLRRLLTYLERQGAPGVALAALRAAGEAWQQGPDASVLWTKLIKMHSRRPQDSSTALGIYRQMLEEGAQPDLVTFNTAITAASRGRQWKAVLGVLADMRGAGVAPDGFTYSALLSACQACGKAEQALEWFEEMQYSGLVPNVVHYTTLMSVMQKAGRWDDSVSVFHQMEAAGITPDVVAHNAAITAYARGGSWEKAWAVFAGMRRAGLRPSAVSYNALLSACERCGQPDRALEVFGRMEREGDPRPTSVTYNTLISSLGKAGRYREAVDMHARMQQAGVPDDVWTLTALITAAERSTEEGAKAGWQAALDWFRDFQSRGIAPNTVAYNRLISALGNGGRWQLALTAFEAMRASSGRGGGAGGNTEMALDVRPDVITYGSLIAALERAGQWQRALQLHEEMQEEGIQTNTYIISSIINACERGGQFREAILLFKRMQEMEAGGLPMGSAATVARKVLYAFPQLVELMPAPLIQAARLTVDTGRAARQWIEGTAGQQKQAAGGRETAGQLGWEQGRPVAERSMAEEEYL